MQLSKDEKVSRRPTLQHRRLPPSSPPLPFLLEVYQSASLLLIRRTMFPSALSTSSSNPASSIPSSSSLPPLPPSSRGTPPSPSSRDGTTLVALFLGNSSLPPPAYHPQPALTITVSQTTHDTLSSATSCGSLQDGVNLRADIEVHERVREEEARARLWPLVYPEARSFTDVLKGAFGRKRHTPSNPPHQVSLDAYDLKILEKMEEGVSYHISLC